MGKRVFGVVVALVAAQVLSGCYFLRELNWSPDKPNPGDSTKLTVGMQSSDSGEEGRFFLIAAGKASGVTPKRPIFDAGDVTGQREKLIEDPALFEIVGETCQFFTPSTLRGPGVPGGLWRTEDDVTSSTKKLVEAKQKWLTDDGGAGFAGIVMTGEWVDDGDDVPEDPDSSDDQITCTGESTTSVITKGGVPSGLR